MREQKPSWAQAREQRIGRKFGETGGAGGAKKIGFAASVTASGDAWREHFMEHNPTTFRFDFEAWSPDQHDLVVNRLCMPERNALDWFKWRGK